jgi:hypothetical protein
MNAIDSIMKGLMINTILILKRILDIIAGQAGHTGVTREQ